MVRLQTHNVHQLDNTLLDVCLVHALVFQRLSKHLVNGEARIQSTGGVLEHHLLVLTQLKNLTRGLAVLGGGSVDQNLTVGVLVELHDFQQGGGLTTTGLTHDGEALTLTNVEGQAVHSLHSAHAALNQRTLHEREVLLDVADLQDGGTLLTRNTVVLRYRGLRNRVQLVCGLTDQLLRDGAGGVVALANAFQQLQIGLAVGVLAALATALSDGATRAEGARGHRVNQVRRGTLNRNQGDLLGTVHTRDRTQQTDGVRVGGMLVQVFCLRNLHRLTGVHHQNVVSHTSHNTQVVGNHDGRCAGLILSLLHNLQHLRLDGHIQCGGGLIGDEHARVIRNRHSDHDALTHTTGELVREGTQAVSRRGNTHHTHQFDGTVLDSLLAHALVVDLEHLSNLITNGVHGGQRGQRILEDHRDLLAAVCAHFLIAQAQQLGAVVLDRTGDVSGSRVQTHDCHGGNGLTGTGLTHNTQGLTGVQVKVHTANSMHDAILSIEADVEVLNAQNGRGTH